MLGADPIDLPRSTTTVLIGSSSRAGPARAQIRARVPPTWCAARAGSALGCLLLDERLLELENAPSQRLDTDHEVSLV